MVDGRRITEFGKSQLLRKTKSIWREIGFGGETSHSAGEGSFARQNEFHPECLKLNSRWREDTGVVKRAAFPSSLVIIEWALVAAERTRAAVDWWREVSVVHARAPREIWVPRPARSTLHCTECSARPAVHTYGAVYVSRSTLTVPTGTRDSGRGSLFSLREQKTFFF